MVHSARNCYALVTVIILKENEKYGHIGVVVVQASFL